MNNTVGGKYNTIIQYNNKQQSFTYSFINCFINMQTMLLFIRMSVIMSIPHYTYQIPKYLLGYTR